MSSIFFSLNLRFFLCEICLAVFIYVLVRMQSYIFHSYDLFYCNLFRNKNLCSYVMDLLYSIERYIRFKTENYATKRTLLALWPECDLSYFALDCFSYSVYVCAWMHVQNVVMNQIWIIQFWFAFEWWSSGERWF